MPPKEARHSRWPGEWVAPALRAHLSMNYRRVKPGASVARFVEFYWILDDTAPTDFTQRIVPDGRAGIILNFADPFESRPNNIWQRQPGCFFIGQITAPLLLRPSGPTAMLGIQFRPDGASQLLRLPMRELNDLAFPLDTLCRPLFNQLNSLRDLRSPARALDALDSVLCSFADRARSTDAALSYAIAELDRSAGLVSIAQLARRLGWSTRQFQRRFGDAVGIPPKLFARMQRFQGIFRATEGQEPDWVSVALHCGYFDQSHLLRDFREFTGKTPTALLHQELGLTRQFLRTETMSHFSKTLGAAAR